MKRFFTLLLLTMSMLAGQVLAQDLVRYQSTQNGLQLLFPGEADIDTDDGQKLILEGDDYLFSAIYFDPESTDDETLQEGYAGILLSSGIDASKGKKSDFESKTLVGVMFVNSDADMLSISGIVYSKDSPDDFGFIFHMLSSPESKNISLKCVKSLEFHPEEIEADED